MRCHADGVVILFMRPRTATRNQDREREHVYFMDHQDSKLCINCIHYRPPDPPSGLAECGRKIAAYSVGLNKPIFRVCTAERLGTAFGWCGKDAIYFQSKTGKLL
jgi:hypothetical protein